MRDPFEMAEGAEALDEIIGQGPPKKKGRPANVKETWEKTSIRMEPELKAQLKARAKSLKLPFEELVHFALRRFLEDIEWDEEIPLKTVTTRRTVL